ncbi:MAG: hypothetical protein Q7R54_01400 [bacterium]|nr:hypothetical protein [bacterium]
MGKGMKRRWTRLDEKLYRATVALVQMKQLQHEIDLLTQGFRNEEIIEMQSGKPRIGAEENEVKARQKFKRMREIGKLLNIPHFRFFQ